MGGVIPLGQTGRLWCGGAEIGALYHGGLEIWRKALALPPLPPQLMPNPALDDPAAWTIHGSWTMTDGMLTHAAGGGQFSKATPATPALGSATDLVISFEVVAQTSTLTTAGVRGMLSGNTSNDQYHNWYSVTNAERQVVPHVSHIYNRTGAQSLVQMEATPSWAGSIRNPQLYDVSFTRHLPTVVLIVGGQSNAEGYGWGQPDVILDRWHPNIWMCPPVTEGAYGAKKDVVSIAQEPLIHNATPGRKPGPAMHAARRIVAATNGGVRVVIVPVAKSATGLLGAAAPWNPDSTLTGENNRYDVMVATHAAAVAQISDHIGTIMLWSGNEADLNVAGWQSQLRGAIVNFIDRARVDLGAPGMQVVMMGAVVADPASPSQLVQMQRTFGHDSGHANAIPGVHYSDGPIGQQ